MLFFDKWISDEWGNPSHSRLEKSRKQHYRETVGFDAARRTAFEISNIAEYVEREELAGRLSNEKDLTKTICAAPPFQHMWFEYDAHAKYDEARPAVGNAVDECTYGVDAMVLDIARGGNDECVANRALAERLNVQMDDASKWLIWMHDFAQYKHASKSVIAGPLFSMLYVVQGDGEVYWHLMYDTQKKGNPQATEEQYGTQRGLLLPVFFALTFMNCRNVVREERKQPRAESRKHQRTHGVPLSTYQVCRLQVDQPVVVRDTDGVGESKSTPLHICRGHFRHYTKERPLFGHYVGPVWVPMHTRGNAANGVRVRDFEVEKG